MTFMAPLVMFGWLAAAIALFLNTTPQRAVVVTVVAGFLFLPTATLKIPGIPAYDKYMAISLSLILGGLVSGQSARFPLKPRFYDLPLVFYCVVVPFATAFSNGLTAYDGFSDMVKAVSGWGVCYWAGRKYFTEPESLRILVKGIVVGGLAYVLPVLFELRMSPQLSNIVYGFSPSEFLQTIRYGGYRPIVFLQHGLMLATWMAAASLSAFCLWRTRKLERLGVLPISATAMLLIVITVLCKSANGWIYLSIGLASSLYYARTGSTRAMRWLLLGIFAYLALRSTNLLGIGQVQAFAGRFFDADRIASLTWRLRQEDLFGAKALLRPVFGWGGYGRGWPIDPSTGKTFQMVDSLWVILFSTNGFAGLISVFFTLGIGPWRIFSSYRRRRGGPMPIQPAYAVDAVILSLILAIFMLDSLMNAMLSPVYVLCAGSLVTFSLAATEGAPAEPDSMSAPASRR